MNDIPQLDFRPRPPQKSCRRNSARRHLYESSVVRKENCSERVNSARSRPKLSQRELMVVKSNKAKYNAWIKKWDRDQGIKRFLMLKDIVDKCKGYSKNQLDELYGNASELVFMRIFVFIRWNCRSTISIDIQLQALRIFFDASSGFCYSEHFLKNGGVDILLSFLELRDEISENDLSEVLKTFLSLSQQGAHSVQYILDTKFLTIFLDTLPSFKDEENLNLATMLLLQLSEGNDAYAETFTLALMSRFHALSSDDEALHSVSHVFRVLLTPKIAAEVDIKGNYNDLLALGSSSNLDIRYDGVIVFSLIAENTTKLRRDFIFDNLLEILLNPLGITNELISRRQTFATKVLLTITKQNGIAGLTLKEDFERFLVPLCKIIGNTVNFSAQKSSAKIITHYYCDDPHIKTLLENAIPTDWIRNLTLDPHTFCLNINQIQADFFLSLEPESFLIDVSAKQTQIRKATTKARLELKHRTQQQGQYGSIIKPTIALRESPFRFNVTTNVDLNALFQQ
ncbi:hypothetical protein TVAG_270780 [Trichomonas vaginalis G3]|uniref:Uncharacterized protein n=1 Tax=Trichomonas vaginalis (strain ATCC PRA-98 / G3) TaxID=412133 RepID=A2FIH0_TRIV3|nr:armadillo-like helical domain containing protein 1 family [Trichomonas vaginalis G3]EAX95287.1 hypothetical protein TVAG_270780 [Trichomonas vaginalis G3]KAI5539344.1 armadillo-like helical domain containing protein 1 family [Trichomonas vaginalis G3]|eukprot:XP_001308217.1 hypothetical protein [Trichomonas vaginalis G3]